MENPPIPEDLVLSSIIQLCINEQMTRECLPYTISQLIRYKTAVVRV